MHANQFQACPNLLHTRSWDPYFCKKEESCKFLLAHILSNDALYACRIPLASFDSWDLGPKIGLDGLHGLAQVWTPLPPDAGAPSRASGEARIKPPRKQNNKSFQLRERPCDFGPRHKFQTWQVQHHWNCRRLQMPGRLNSKPCHSHVKPGRAC